MGNILVYAIVVVERGEVTTDFCANVLSVYGGGAWGEGVCIRVSMYMCIDVYVDL